MTYTRAILIAICIMAATVFYADPASAAPRAVSLADASRPPSHLWYVPAHGNLTITDVAYSDIQAYRWDGSALPAQTGRDVFHWGKRVTFKVRTGRFINGRRQPVLLALWR
jgi:hypothetical protein